MGYYYFITFTCVLVLTFVAAYGSVGTTDDNNAPEPPTRTTTITTAEPTYQGTVFTTRPRTTVLTTSTRPAAPLRLAIKRPDLVGEFTGGLATWSAFGYDCTFRKQGGFHSNFEWKWTGTLNCGSLGEWSDTSANPADPFKGTLKQYLVDVLKLTTKEQLIQAVRRCSGCNFDQADTNEIVDHINRH